MILQSQKFFSDGEFPSLKIQRQYFFFVIPLQITHINYYLVENINQSIFPPRIFKTNFCIIFLSLLVFKQILGPHIIDIKYQIVLFLTALMMAIFLTDITHFDRYAVITCGSFWCVYDIFKYVCNHRALLLIGFNFLYLRRSGSKS